MLTKLVVRAPFDMTWPILIKDRSFDLDRHVVRVALPTPGSQEQLDEFISDFLSRPLSPQRPLWQMLVIEGRANGNAVLVMKAHHALADGVSFAETFANLFDISPEVRTEVDVDDEEASNSATSLGLLGEGLSHLRQRPQLIVENVASWGSRFYEIVRALVAVALIRGRRHATPDQPSMLRRDARRSTDRRASIRRSCAPGCARRSETGGESAPGATVMTS